MSRTVSLIKNNRTAISVESWCDFSCFTVRFQLNAHRPSNAARLFVERRTIVCRTPHDCLSNAAQLFVERRTMGRVWIDSSKSM